MFLFEKNQSSVICIIGKQDTSNLPPGKNRQGGYMITTTPQDVIKEKLGQDQRRKSIS